MGSALIAPAARRRLRRVGLQPDQGQGASRWRAPGAKRRRHRGRAGRHRHRVHHRRHVRGPGRARCSARMACCPAARSAADRRGLLHGLGGGLRAGPGAAGRAGHRAARRPGHGQPQGGQRRPADPGGVRAAGQPSSDARPYLDLLGAGSTYVGEGELARIVKLCHNLFLGVVTQSLAEVTILAQKSGVSRQAFLACLNDSVMGSTFTRYKTPALVNLDFHATFTAVAAAQGLRPRAGRGPGARGPDAGGRARASARAEPGRPRLRRARTSPRCCGCRPSSAGLELVSENAEVSDGLEPDRSRRTAGGERPQ